MSRAYFQFRPLGEEVSAVRLALRRPNLSVYARDGAVIFGVQGCWQPGQPPTEEWETIRSTFWKFGSAGEGGEFLLGDFAMLARFFALAQATAFRPAAEGAEVLAAGDEAAPAAAVAAEPAAGEGDA